MEKLALCLAVPAAIAAVAYYVHQTCVTALGPTEADNTVVFQPASTSEDTSAPGPVAAEVEPVSPSTLVVILGWGGATRKQLRRIIDFTTQQLQCPVVSYINPMLQLLEGDLDAQCIDQLLTTIQEQLEVPGGPRSFVIFSHSNNGSFVYGALKEAIQRGDADGKYRALEGKLKGVIFDSAPALFSTRAGSTTNAASSSSSSPSFLSRVYHGVKAAFSFSFPSVAIVLKKPRYVHPFWTPAITIWAILFKLAHPAPSDQLAAGGRPRRPAFDARERLIAQLQNDVPSVPHLFLYSQGDKLLRAEWVREYINHLRTAYPNLPITEHDFHTTGHVQHLLRRPKQYAEEVRRFLGQLEL